MTEQQPLYARTPARPREAKPPKHVRQWINQQAHAEAAQFEQQRRQALIEQWQAGLLYVSRPEAAEPRR